MTIICVLDQDKETWIGSDTLSSNGNFTFLSIPKWIVADERAIGCSGSQRVGELIEADRGTLFKLAVTPLEVGNYIREICLEDGFEPARDDKGHGWKYFDQSFIYVDQTGIHFLDSTFAPALVREPFLARGSGCDIAFGAYHALTNHADCSPCQLVERVVSAAICHDDGCGGDVWTHRLI